ncbi:histidine phosphatase family protein [Aureimonas leprariae]|uniref:Histidine phosphatase family protein n=1 Tax=Plantimonas leprariae TaxID=2615207 RepID=A0A7V7PMU2_9HYPH|nr:histidine phosphatase family protein [Aureimonas leprariae]KAB0678529.1 histidine phosphatase family protein [Aureimonas leprariae]
MTAQSAWPSRLWIVRHGESLGNVAREAAMAGDLARIDIAERDIDVPLSPLGEEQARSVGRWFASLPADRRPEHVLSSPYRRARQTAELIAGQAGLPHDVAIDERLREKEFGILDRLTTRGILELHPEQAEFRRLLGKFYHRPPGGESWCDVVLRLRSLMDTIGLHYGDRRVLIVCHQVVVLCLRYIVETLDEERILAIDREGDVANGAVTEYEADRSGEIERLALRRYNFVAPLEEQDTPVTAEPDANVAAR